VPSYRLRPATAQDAGFLADAVIEATRAQGRVQDGFDERQWRESFVQWTIKQIQGEIAGSVTSVIEVEDEQAGRLRIVRGTDHIELCGIQLLPGFQRRGIGTALITELKAQAAAAGLPLELEVEKDNPQAHKLYQRLGFRQVGETGQEYKLRWTAPPGS